MIEARLRPKHIRIYAYNDQDVLSKRQRRFCRFGFGNFDVVDYLRKKVYEIIAIVKQEQSVCKHDIVKDIVKG